MIASSKLLAETSSGIKHTSSSVQVAMLSGVSSALLLHRRVAALPNKREEKRYVCPR